MLFLSVGFQQGELSFPHWKVLVSGQKMVRSARIRGAPLPEGEAGKQGSPLRFTLQVDQFSILR
jgi:hypothetical protein